MSRRLVLNAQQGRARNDEGIDDRIGDFARRGRDQLHIHVRQQQNLVCRQGDLTWPFVLPSAVRIGERSHGFVEYLNTVGIGVGPGFLQPGNLHGSWRRFVRLGNPVPELAVDQNRRLRIVELDTGRIDSELGSEIDH